MSTDTSLDVHWLALPGPRAHLLVAKDTLSRAYDRARGCGYALGSPEMAALHAAEAIYLRAKAADAAHRRAPGRNVRAGRASSA